MNTSDIADNVRAFARDSVELVRKEVQLAKLETTEKVEMLVKGLVFVIVGALLLVVALGVLFEALILGLAVLLGGNLLLAQLIVGGLIVLVGVVLLLKGMNNLKPENLKPSRTLRTTERGYEKIREAA